VCASCHLTPMTVFLRSGSRTGLTAHEESACFAAITGRPPSVTGETPDAQGQIAREQAEYALRGGVEGTVRQAVAVTGVRRVRYRGLAKTRAEHIDAHQLRRRAQPHPPSAGRPPAASATRTARWPSSPAGIPPAALVALAAAEPGSTLTSRRYDYRADRHLAFITDEVTGVSRGASVQVPLPTPTDAPPGVEAYVANSQHRSSTVRMTRGDNR
jgi:hypothetical protein